MPAGQSVPSPWCVRQPRRPITNGETTRPGGNSYGRRFASQMGKRVIGNTIQLGVENLLREDSRFLASGRQGLFPRLAGAVENSVVIQSAGGRRAPPVGRLTAAFGAGVISRTWYPPGDDSVPDGLRSGAKSFGWHVLTNVLREFLPEIRKGMHF